MFQNLIVHEQETKDVDGYISSSYILQGELHSDDITWFQRHDNHINTFIT